ncbi:MAG: bifunctional hydroxymethylpyrimidine kinase/phosphomethylpyrimidine kinase [Nitrospirae bacterium RBG_16_64_22]|nr:MAG: bifunctional hydroxymethylpyrimidine kinase/phosphomethylpyrimidine kinase [Nitrospirae bacterium RBG_16_64_22]
MSRRTTKAPNLPFVRKALSIAGSDPSGGAGIQADLKVFTLLGVYGMGVPTSLTAQNTSGVGEIFGVPSRFLEKQLGVLFADLTPDVVKTGMLWDEKHLPVIAEALKAAGNPPLVVDPILKSGTGTPLFPEKGIKALMRLLFPLATIITPNVPEAKALTGVVVDGLESMKEAADALLETGARAVLIKGGHLPPGKKGQPAKIMDVLFHEEGFEVFESERTPGGPFHGTGCVLSAAIAACLARGESLSAAVGSARQFLDRAIAAARPVGKGRLPLNLSCESESSSKP